MVTCQQTGSALSITWRHLFERHPGAQYLGRKHMSVAVFTKPMTGRDPHEPHRASTPLELLFDLCFVVAVAQAAAALHHALAENHIADGIVGFLTVFFAIWWAWMNFTWFASSYDTDDVVYRLLTLVQISGVLVLAAGIEDAFDGDFKVITIGYVIMRFAMITQWLRAAAQHPEGRRTAQRYALAIFVVQAGWLVRLALPESLWFESFVFLALAELLSPVFAELGGGSRQMTPWHPEHIAERYGLFVIIVLGEGILSSFTAINGAVGVERISTELVIVAVSSLITMFGLWWSYFSLRSATMLEQNPKFEFPVGLSALRALRIHRCVRCGRGSRRRLGQPCRTLRTLRRRQHAVDRCAGGDDHVVAGSAPRTRQPRFPHRHDDHARLGGCNHGGCAARQCAWRRDQLGADRRRSGSEGFGFGRRQRTR